jgi:uracil-DNA glycosylase
MRSPATAAEYLPSRLSLKALREAADGCRACPLWRTGTQTVFGEGRKAARLLLVGEQPGDREDLAGRPFVGPAGRLLDEALEEAGIDRANAYAVVEPRVLVCLGATAAQALLGRGVRVTRDRGRPLESELAPVAFATVHPSSILRAPDEASRQHERALFVDDLRVAATALVAVRA